MKKEDQKLTNEASVNLFYEAISEYRNTPINDRIIRRLFHCPAETIETDNYYILRSYNTFIAAYSKKFKVFVDVLRYEYGYTSTSNQHYSKFKSFINSKEYLFYNYTEWRYKNV